MSIALLSATLLCACGGRGGGSPPTLTASQLQNAGYRSEWSAEGVVRLVDGEYMEEIVPGAASRLNISIVSDSYAFGDLDGDGAGDAVVALATSGGGSGTFITLEAVINDRGIPRHAGTAELGDRIRIRSVEIESGVIVVRMLTHGSGDPMVDPTVETTQRYRLEAGELEEVR
jgi:hypothetical protein